MSTVDESCIGDDASQRKELQGIGEKTWHLETSTLLAINGIDLSGLSACNGMSPGYVAAGSSTEQLDCLHLDLAEGDRDMHSGLEHNVSQQFCPVIQTNMYYKE